MGKETPAEPLVSIVIPCYNRETCVADAINSALRQSYSHVEVVVVDDGSVDGTVEVIKEFGARVHLIQQPNQGPGAARNTGVKNSQGEFIIFLDSDDWLSDDIVEIHVRASERWPDADIYGADTARIRNDDEIEVTQANWPETPNSAMQLLLLRPPLYFPSQMYRLSALERIGGLDESLSSNEDVDCCLRVALTGGKIVRSDGGYSVYRPSDNSLTRAKLSLFRNHIILAHRLAREFAREDTGLASLFRERILRIRFQYWLSYLKYHLSWKGLAPLKFLLLLGQVCAIDPGFLVFVLRDHPWTLPPEKDFGVSGELDLNR